MCFLESGANKIIIADVIEKISRHLFVYTSNNWTNKQFALVLRRRGAKVSRFETGDVTKRGGLLAVSELAAANRDDLQRNNTSTIFENYSYYAENYIGGHFEALLHTDNLWNITWDHRFYWLVYWILPQKIVNSAGHKYIWFLI